MGVGEDRLVAVAAQVAVAIVVAKQRAEGEARAAGQVGVVLRLRRIEDLEREAKRHARLRRDRGLLDKLSDALMRGPCGLQNALSRSSGSSSGRTSEAPLTLPRTVSRGSP